MTRYLWTSAAAACALVLAITAPASAKADKAFGGDGSVTVDLPGNDVATFVVEQSNGKVVAAGVSGNRVGVIRLHRDGKSDRSFSSDGKTTIPIKQGAVPIGLHVRPDGSILVGVWVWNFRPYTGNETVDIGPQVALDGYRFGVVKLARNGSIDRRYGSNGLALSQGDELRPRDDFTTSMDVARDGAVVALGFTGVSAGYFGAALAPILMRFTPKGAVDASFGLEGIMPLAEVYPGQLPLDIAVQRDGKIVIGSHVNEGIVNTTWSVSRLLPSGLPDREFGTGGRTRLDPNELGSDFFNGLAIQPDGKILAFGEALGGVAWSSAFARLDRDGTLDTKFGRSGWVIKQWFGDASYVSDLAVVDGRRIVVGVNTWGGGGSSSLIARYTSNGKLDPSFDGDGSARVGLEMITAVASRTGRVIASGVPHTGDGFTLVAVRP